MFSSYLCGLQRGFICFYRYGNLDLIKNKIFIDLDTRMFHVVDNLYKKVRGEGEICELQNFLTKEDIFVLYESRNLSQDNPLGFITRMIFHLALARRGDPGSFTI